MRHIAFTLLLSVATVGCDWVGVSQEAPDARMPPAVLDDLRRLGWIPMEYHNALCVDKR